MFFVPSFFFDPPSIFFLSFIFFFFFFGGRKGSGDVIVAVGGVVVRVLSIRILSNLCSEGIRTPASSEAAYMVDSRLDVLGRNWHQLVSPVADVRVELDNRKAIPFRHVVQDGPHGVLQLLFEERSCSARVINVEVK